MSKEVVEFLRPQPGQVFLDCTLGSGGHAEEILKRILPGGQLIGIDRDMFSLGRARERLHNFGDQCHFIHDDFRNLDLVLDGLNIREIDGALFDLGVSSMQLDNPERGFSIKAEGPLDMRMDQESYISAYDLVNSLSEQEISAVLKNFGQERFHNRIAHLLVQKRVKSPIATTRELSDIVLQAIPYRYHGHSIHPATRTFQAFRIAVNRELEALEIGLKKAIDYLRVGGRLCAISFHSLEDKIVKDIVRDYVHKDILKMVTPKPLRPTAEEMRDNPRSRSAKFRVAERI
jgi:16S rRNA (cytosine1402-N4)-methyltransferase